MQRVTTLDGPKDREKKKEQSEDPKDTPERPFLR